MPTAHVAPDSKDLLQEIANGLLKARKVIVVTGAGISTNSGIPDFRSENGLYSLIQAQFDAATRQERRNDDQGQTSGDDATDFESERACKRRRISRESTAESSDTVSEAKDEIEVQGLEEEIEVSLDTIVVEREEVDAEIDAVESKSEQAIPAKKAKAKPLITPRRTRSSTRNSVQPTTSPLSSPPAEDMLPPSGLFRHTRSNLADVSIPPSSSPLSSPPPVLFEPFLNTSPSEDSSSRQSSTAPSEVDDSPLPINPLTSSSQTSNPGRNTLPNMKGKDLFDASIWSDPIRTSVFYTFATSLRQKVKDVEPTSSHRFISHLRDRGKLVRCYTQNIDQIEEKVGLSTTLQDGPGSRGRFSRRSTANMNQLNRMVEEANNGDTITLDDKSPQASQESSQPAQASQTDGTTTPKTEGDATPSDAQPAKLSRKDLPRSGVECVFLHGSLELLRCFLCGRVCSWDDDDREIETLSGQQPECPHCVGATTAREERGKRALGVGKLRPDIVLYGEEHPNAHLISPIVTHDLALSPDMLLILGTSLRVHGLKVMVREFAKAVHSKGGKVVFVNFTKPPESSWGDIIDYWIEWDCDAWVADLQDKVPKLWQTPEPPKPKKKRESGVNSDDNDKPEVKRPPPAHPVALRDTKVTGAYWTLKILKELHNITGFNPPIDRRNSISTSITSVTTDTTIEAGPNPLQRPARSKSRRPRKSAPGALERLKRTPSTLNPNHGRSRKPTQADEVIATPVKEAPAVKAEVSSILDSVKANPRVRKRKRMFGDDEATPATGRRGKPTTPPEKSGKRAQAGMENRLPPFEPQPPSPATSPYGRPRPMEIRSPPLGPPGGPLAPISANFKGTVLPYSEYAFSFSDPLARHLEHPPWRIEHPPTWWTATEGDLSINAGRESRETNAALALAGLCHSPTAMMSLPAAPALIQPQTTTVIAPGLRSWGETWHAAEDSGR